MVGWLELWRAPRLPFQGSSPRDHGATTCTGPAGTGAILDWEADDLSYPTFLLFRFLVPRLVAHLWWLSLDRAALHTHAAMIRLNAIWRSLW